jgi:hypothetical protein
MNEEFDFSLNNLKKGKIFLLKKNIISSFDKIKMKLKAVALK